MKPKIQIILGSVRQGRNGEKVASWLMRALKDNQSAELELVDLKDFNLPIFDDAVSPSYREGEHENPVVKKWLDKMSEADGYIIATAEYNHSVPGALKNAIDFIFKEWKDKAVGFVGYGGSSGGSRAIEHLRQITAEINMHGIREQLLIPMVWAAFDDQGELLDKNATSLANAIVDKISTLAVKLKI